MLYHARVITATEDRTALPSKKETSEHSTEFLKDLKPEWRKAGVKLAPAQQLFCFMLEVPSLCLIPQSCLL